MASLGELPTTPAWSLKRQGTLEAQGKAYFSFTQPASGPRSFVVYLNTVGSASVLAGSINSAGLAGGVTWTPAYT